MNNSKLVQYSRFGLGSAAWIFTICIAIQVFIAGLSVFVSPVNWMHHEALGFTLSSIPIVMIVLAYLAKADKKQIRQCLLLIGLVIAAIVTAAMSSDVSIVGALHPVIALLLFWNSIKMLPPYTFKTSEETA